MAARVPEVQTTLSTRQRTTCPAAPRDLSAAACPVLVVALSGLCTSWISGEVTSRMLGQSVTPATGNARSQSGSSLGLIHHVFVRTVA
jgi:hypothetical protein